MPPVRNEIFSGATFEKSFAGETTFAARFVVSVAIVSANIETSTAIGPPTRASSATGSQITFPSGKMIAVAEVCSWYAVLTTSYIGNAMEQSIWTLTAAMLATALFFQWRRASGMLSYFLAASMIACAGFVAFMCTVDVPMYLSRYLLDETQGRPYLSLAQGLQDVSLRWVVTHSWQEWHEEIAWMTLYFSVAVWTSIALPRPHATQ